MYKKKGGRGLSNIKDSVDASIRWHEYKMKKSKERLIPVTRNNAEKQKYQQNNNN